MVDFGSWVWQVDEMVEEMVGLSVHDLPDCDFRSWFNDEVPPEEAAERAIDAAMM